MLTISNQQKQIDELNTFKSLSKKVSSTSFENLGKTSGKIKLLEEKIDDMEQRSRNQCLWIHVISEQADENTDLDLTMNEIQSFHHLGPKEKSTHDRRSKKNTVQDQS